MPKETLKNYVNVINYCLSHLSLGIDIRSLTNNSLFHGLRMTVLGLPLILRFLRIGKLKLISMLRPRMFMRFDPSKLLLAFFALQVLLDCGASLLFELLGAFGEVEARD